MKQPRIGATRICGSTKHLVYLQDQKGFSFLELVLVIIIIGLLLIVAIEKLLILKVEAERTAMETILGNLRSAISLQVADHITKGKVAELAKAHKTNPMVWLSVRPDNYIGVLDEPDPTDIKPYTWYFDKYNNELVYKVGNADYFESKSKDVKRARFKLKLDYTDADNNGRYSPQLDEIHGLTLNSVEPYTWLVEPVNIEDYTSENGTTASRTGNTNK